MAKQLRVAAADGATKGMKAGDNGFDPDVAGDLVERILNLHTELETESGRIREQIGEVYAEGKEGGIAKKLLKEVVTQKRAAEKLVKREEELETDYPGDLDKLKQVLGMLGDTPLGKAAVDKAEARAAAN